MKNYYKNLGVLLVLIIFVLCSAGSLLVEAKALELSLATKMGTQSPEYKAIEYFAELVEKKSQDRLKISIFGSEVLGTDETVFKGLKMGAVDIYVGSLNIAPRMFVPELDYFTPLFVYEDFAHFIRFCKSDYAKKKWEELSEKANVIMLSKEFTWRRGPFRVLCTKKPIKSIDDLKGLKLRFYPSKLELDMWESLGTSPTVIAWSETYLALKQGIVEAVTSPVTLILDTKFVEVCPYVTRVDEYPQTICFFMNKDKFQILSEGLQKALIDACTEAGTHFTNGLDAIAEEILEKAKAQYNIKFSEIDMGPFIKKSNQYYEEQKKKGTMPKEFWEVINAIELAR